MTASQSVDSSGFRAFEHGGWQKIPKQYHESFSDLTPQAIGPLLDAVGVSKGIRLLDVASGPGYVTAAAVGRGANTVGIDFSAEMVAEARRQHPAVEFQEGDAEELPFPDGSFDAVVINFGLLQDRVHRLGQARKGNWVRDCSSRDSNSWQHERAPSTRTALFPLQRPRRVQSSFATGRFCDTQCRRCSAGFATEVS